MSSPREITRQRKRIARQALFKRSRRRLEFERLERRFLLASAWTNPLLSRDIDRDGLVTPLDVLAGINERLDPTVTDTSGFLSDRGQHPEAPFFDASGDEFFSPVDIVLIVNALNFDFTGPDLLMQLVNDTAPRGEVNDDRLTFDARVQWDTSDELTGVAELTWQVDAGPLVTVELPRSGVITPELPTDGTVDGEHTVNIQATDAVGNTTTQSFTFTMDTTPPDAPPDLRLLGESDTGRSSTDGITNDTTPTVIGSGLPGQVINLFVDGVDHGTTEADEANQWTITTGELEEGLREVTANAEDAAGNTSSLSTPLAVTIDTTAPSAAVLALDPSSDTGLSNSDNFTADNTPLINGMSDADTTTQLIAGGGLLVGEVSGEIWSIELAELPEGAFPITGVSEDVAGNTTTSESLLLTIKTTPPPAPPVPDLDPASDTGDSDSDDITAERTPTFRGVTSPGSQIELFEGGTSLGGVLADPATGEWIVTLSEPLFFGEHNIVAVETDLAGNVSPPSEALLLTIVIPVGGAVGGFIRFDGLSGEFQDTVHNQWSEISFFDQSLFTGANGRPDASSLQDIQIAAPMDRTGPEIADAAANGRIFPLVELHVTAQFTDEGAQTYYAYELENVAISSYSVVVGAFGVVQQQYSLNFDGIRLTYTGFDGTRPSEELSFEARVDALALEADRPTQVPDPNSIAGAPLHAASSLFVRFEGLRGESTNESHAGFSNVSQVALGVQLPIQGAGPARQFGAPQFTDIEITAELDRTHPSLVEALAGGIVFPSVDLEATTFLPDQQEEVFLTYRLSDVRVVGYDFSANANGEILPSYRLRAQQIDANYRQLDANGEVLAETQFRWIPSDGQNLRFNPADGNSRADSSTDGQALSVASSIFVRSDLLPGTSALPGREDWSEISGFGHFLNVPNPADDRPLPVFSELTVSSELDQNSPLLQELVARGDLQGLVEIEVVAPLDGAPILYTVRLTEVLLTNYVVQANAGGAATQQYSLSFGAIEVIYTEFDAFGVVVDTVPVFLEVPDTEAIVSAGHHDDNTTHAVGQQLGVASRIFARFEGFDGESTEENHVGWSEISSVDHTFFAPVGGSGRSRIRQPLMVGNLSVLAPVDRIGPTVANALAVGHLFPTVEIHVTAQSDTGLLTFYAYELTNVVVASYSFDGAAGGQLSHRYELNFEAIAATYTRFDEAGEPVEDIPFFLRVPDSAALVGHDEGVSSSPTNDRATGTRAVGGQALSAAAAMFIRFDGLKGEVVDRAPFDGFSVIDGFSHDLFRPITGSGVGRELGEALFSDLFVSSPLDTTGPELAEALALGTIFPEVEIAVTGIPVEPEEVIYTVTLSNVLLTDYNVGADSGGDLRHAYALNFDRIESTYTVFDGNGGAVDDVTFFGTPGGAVALTEEQAAGSDLGQRLVSPESIFVRFEGIEGDVGVEGFEGWSTVSHLDHGLRAPVSRAGEDRTRGDLQFTELQLVGVVDRSGVLLEDAFVRGQLFASVEVHVAVPRTDGRLQTAYRVELERARLTNYAVGGDVDAPLQQRLGLTYDEIRIVYTELAVDGTPLGDVEFSFQLPPDARPAAAPAAVPRLGQPFAPALPDPLGQAELDKIVQAATQLWGAAGADIADIGATSIQVAQLAAGTLGIAYPRQVLIDADGGGHGWFVDQTPLLNEEFLGHRADPDGPASRKMDLLTVVAHELGHVLGLGHLQDHGAPGVMHHTLATGQRRLPTEDDVHALEDDHHAADSSKERRLVHRGEAPQDVTVSPPQRQAAKPVVARRPAPIGINAEGDPELQFRVETFDLQGEPISSVQSGEEFLLQGFVTDLRADPEGVLAAYLDVSYAPEFATPTSPISYGTRFTRLPAGTLRLGQVDEVGAVGITIPGDRGAEERLFTVRMQATGLGLVEFVPNPSEGSQHGSLFFDSDSPLNEDRMQFLGSSLQVVDAPLRVVGNNLDSAELDTFPSTMTLVFSEQVVISTVDVTRVLVNGIPALSSNLIDAQTIEFVISNADEGPGPYEVVLEEEAAISVFGQPLELYTTTFVVFEEPLPDPFVEIHLEAFDLAGNVISSVGVGNQFELRGFATDLREEAVGVFSAYLDVNFNSQLVDVAGELDFGPRFPHGRGDVSPGLLDEVGAFSDSVELGDGTQQLLFRVLMSAESVGNLSFRPEPSDLRPLHEVTLVGIDTPILDNRVRLVGTDIEVRVVDFGDAPAPYPTRLAEGGPHHNAVGPRLGVNRDTEHDGQPSAGADGDSVDGISDEDGVQFDEMRVGQFDGRVFVEVLDGPARVDAWIDFNRDGSWGGPFEQILDDATFDTGVTFVEFNVPSWAAPGSTYARFRVSNQGNLAPTGGAVSGEVEDYELFIEPPLVTAGGFTDGQLISSTSGGARSVFAGDLDGDGDLDVVSAAYTDGSISWHENRSFPDGDFQPPRPIAENSPGVWQVLGADVDGDRDLDVLAAAPFENKIAWYENTDGEGNFSLAKVISTTATTVASLFAADIDGDGDQDVVAATTVDNTVEWYENIDGRGTFGPEQVITTDAQDVLDVFVGDLDRDGDVDVVSASLSDNKIAWYENRLNTIDGGFAPQQLISDTATRASQVFAVDLDGDSDLDVLSASRSNSEIRWHENRLNESEAGFAPQQPISAEPIISTSLFAADVDGDGDPDVLATSAVDNKIVLYENLVNGEETRFGSQQTISATAANPQSVIAADLDFDLDLDVISASADDNSIRWHANRNSSIELQDNPGEPETVTVNEGELARRGGTFDYFGAGALVWTASIGTIEPDSDGTWLWTYTPTDDSPAPQSVVITASADLTAEVTFDLVVANVAPSNVDLVATRGEGPAENVVTLSGGILDPGDDSHTVLVNWGDGTVDEIDPSDREYTATHAYANIDEVVIQVTVTDDEGAADTDELLVPAASGAPRVVLLEPTRTGFVAHLDRDLDETIIEGFRTPSALLRGDSSGRVAGSLIVDPSLRQVTFVKSLGLLVPDTYRVLLPGVSEGVIAAADRRKDQVGVANFETTFLLDEPPEGAVTVSVPNIVRGPGQEVTLPADSDNGIPIRLSGGVADVRSVEFSIGYDPALLQITDVRLAEGISEDASVVLDDSVPGVTTVSLFSPTQLPADSEAILHLVASVPEANANQIYLSKQVIDLQAISILGEDNVVIPAIDDDSVHLVAYLGEASGNGRLNSFDASVVARVVSFVDSEFDIAPLMDPLVIGDVTGNDRLNASDSSRIARAGALFPIPEIPPIPPGVVTSPSPLGPDPKLSIPRDRIARVGGVVQVPVLIESEVDLQAPHRLAGADVAIHFDPTVITATSVTAGDFLVGRSGWGHVAHVDNGAGRIVILAFSVAPVAGTFAGELVNIEFAVSSDAALGATSLNLVAHVNGASTSLVDENDGFLELEGPVTNAPTDSVDGVVTVVEPTSAALRYRKQIDAPNTVPVDQSQSRNNSAESDLEWSEIGPRGAAEHRVAVDRVMTDQPIGTVRDFETELDLLFGSIDELLSAR